MEVPEKHIPEVSFFVIQDSQVEFLLDVDTSYSRLGFNAKV